MSSAKRSVPRVDEDAQGTPVYANNAIVSPVVPFAFPLPHSLQGGDLIILEGFLPSKSSGFTIKLNHDRQGTQTDQLLHISVRLDKKGGGVVVRNSCIGGRWGEEQRSGGLGKLRLGKPLQCFILVRSHCYKVSFNGQHFCEFDHRAGFAEANQLAVEGAIELDHLSYQKPATSATVPSSRPAMPLLQKDVDGTNDTGKPQDKIAKFPIKYGWTLPLNELIEGGMSPGRMIYISAKPFKRTKGFTVDLCHDKDIALHLKAELEGATSDRHVLCNTRQRERWGSEVRLREVPFSPGKHFDLVILSQETGYKISVNNRHLAQYTHRVTDLAGVTRLEVTGEVTLLHVRLL